MDLENKLIDKSEQNQQKLNYPQFQKQENDDKANINEEILNENYNKNLNINISKTQKDGQKIINQEKQTEKQDNQEKYIFNKEVIKNDNNIDIDMEAYSKNIERYQNEIQKQGNRN
ncbi:hypothetical protein PPERSA_05064 [Pseudocohnilembus persalinus]|uniref:Uncharacterized protein n=1 Tax=Pseudocohnilembus persalinus TaxID=266149 RepID=A0A0V0QVL1_PSEPJ|nr:hypothetical protein PPERSA_05064 [Pseudocohnilembus persalinus]|eukprot:KRX06451.1 hypothetical protein PPERSA_05064 [Pseudocohnilembus persalinus]